LIAGNERENEPIYIRALAKIVININQVAYNVRISILNASSRLFSDYCGPNNSSHHDIAADRE